MLANIITDKAGVAQHVCLAATSVHNHDDVLLHALTDHFGLVRAQSIRLYAVSHVCLVLDSCARCSMFDSVDVLNIEARAAMRACEPVNGAGQRRMPSRRACVTLFGLEKTSISNRLVRM